MLQDIRKRERNSDSLGLVKAAVLMGPHCMAMQAVPSTEVRGSRERDWQKSSLVSAHQAAPAFALEEEQLSLVSNKVPATHLVVHLQGPIFPERVPFSNSH